MVALSEDALRASGLARTWGGPNYASDSGMSEGGPMVRPSSRADTHRSLPPIKRKQMTGSSEMHVEVRPSMLSSDRIALTQHSGKLFHSDPEISRTLYPEICIPGVY